MFGLLTKQYILKHVSQEEIFEHFLGLSVKPGVLLRSPLRQDKNPTCEFRIKNGKIYFIDYSGDFFGDCFDAIKRLYGVDFYTSLDIVAEEFGLIVSTEKREIVRAPKKSSVTEKEEHSYKEIEIMVRDWEKEDLDYWNKFEINLNTLQYFKVFPAQNVFVNGRLVYGYTSSNPAYAYRFGEKQYKIYFPFKQTMRFMGNTGAIQGLKQLPKKGKLLILTKSMKDVMVLRRFGLYSVAFQAETIIPSEKDLQPFLDNWDKVVSLYDFDLAGIRSANIMRKKYGIQPFFLTNGKLGTKDYGAKDPAEYVEHHGKYEAFKLKNLWMKYLS